MPDTATNCTCGKTKLIFRCGGINDGPQGSPTGRLTGAVAGRLAAEGLGAVASLEELRDGDPAIFHAAAAAGAVLALDGCGNHCCSRILDGAGVRGFRTMSLSEAGFRKGGPEGTEDDADHAASLAGERLRCPLWREGYGY